MSLIQEILHIVSNYPGGYRGIYDLLYGEDGHRIKNDAKEAIKRANTLRVTLSRLKKNGLVINKDGIWKITYEGKQSVANKEASLKKFVPEDKKISTGKEKKIIVIFDVPESKRKCRNWLREELIGLGYEPIQKSVWFGPALPEKFISHIAGLDILQYVRFFEVKERDLT